MIPCQQFDIELQPRPLGRHDITPTATKFAGIRINPISHEALQDTNTRRSLTNCLWQFNNQGLRSTFLLYPTVKPITVDTR